MSDSSQPSSSEPRSVASAANERRALPPALAQVKRRVVLLVLVLVASLALPQLISLPRSPLTGELSWGWLATTLGGCSFVLAAALLAIRHAIQPGLVELARERAELDERHTTALGGAQATNQYLRDVSHELRASMHAVLGLTQLLARSPLDANQHRQVRTIDGAARALLRIMNDLLALSGPEPHTFDVVPMGCSLHELLRIAHDLVEPSATDRGLALDLRIAVELPDRVVTDAGRVQQIALGLFRYAIETSEQGPLRIDARCKTLGDQRFELSLAVQKPAAPAANEDRALPAADGADEKAPSSLAGLALAQRLATLLGGRIQWDGPSNALELSLPMSRIDPVVVEDAAPPRASPLPASIRLPATVSPLLLVDGDEHDQAEAVDLLEGLGFDVEVAADGAQALERLAHNKYAVILLATDVREPAGREGVSSAEALRAELGSARPAIIGCTREPLQRAFERPGAKHFTTIVSKPLERNALSVVLAQWLADETHPASSGLRLSKIGALAQATRRALDVRLSAAPANGLPDLEPGRRSERALELFVLETPEQLVNLARAAARGRRDEVATLAERLKERCSNCGAVKMAALCRTLEGARDLSLEQLGTSVKALGQALEAVLTLMGEPTPALEGAPASAASDRNPESP
jgi:CheY-like chemotaxis protein/HPt (histidine-containing phosphotransfer) domain-containing protein